MYFLDLIYEFWRTVFLWSVNVCFLRSVSPPIVSMSIPLLCQCSYSLMVLYLFLVSLSICLWVCSHSYLSAACSSLRLCVDMFLRVMFGLCLRADLGRVRIVRVFSTCQMCIFLIWSLSFGELFYMMFEFSISITCVFSWSDLWVLESCNFYLSMFFCVCDLFRQL